VSDHATHSVENGLVRFASRPVLSPAARNLSKPCWSKSLIRATWSVLGRACVRTRESPESTVCRLKTSPRDPVRFAPGLVASLGTRRCISTASSTRSGRGAMRPLR